MLLRGARLRCNARSRLHSSPSIRARNYTRLRSFRVRENEAFTWHPNRVDTSGHTGQRARLDCKAMAWLHFTAIPCKLCITLPGSSEGVLGGVGGELRRAALVQELNQLENSQQQSKVRFYVIRIELSPPSTIVALPHACSERPRFDVEPSESHPRL